jgi:hypothetical protein
MIEIGRFIEIPETEQKVKKYNYRFEFIKSFERMCDFRNWKTSVNVMTKENNLYFYREAIK